MPEISKEVQSLRSENSKTFDLGKGKRRLEAHIGAIHYRNNYADLSELWKDIDLTWEGNRITKAPYELTHESNKLTLRNKRTGNLTTIELDSIGGLKIPDVAWERSRGLAKAPGIVTIDNVALDFDLEVITEFSAVRFRRVLKSDKAPLEAKFKVTGDTSLVSVRASDEDGDIPVETSLKDGILTETLKPDRVVKYPVRIDPTWKVSTGYDDCFRRLPPAPSSWSRTRVYVSAGGHDVYYKNGSGMRFTNITIPQGSTIDNGTHLTFRARTAASGGACKSRISAEDVDDAPPFADDAAAFDNRWAARTTARVGWDAIPAWTANVDYDSPEIKTVIKEIVDRGGWSSGQDIVIFWEDFDDRSDHVDGNTRESYSYEGSSTYAPRLVITYTPPPVVAPTVTTQAVDDILPTTATGNVTITDNGGENCSKRGICWNTSPNPTVANDKSEETDSFGIGAFERPMTGLLPSTHYYAKGYAYNSAGYGYGSQVEFTTNKDCTGSDTGSGVEAMPARGITLPDSGSGVDGHKAVAPQSVGETGEGVDALTALLGILARSETGLGTDAKLSLAVALIKADAGSGVEHILDRALVLISESGSGLDVSHLVKTLMLTDGGTAAENSYLHILEGVKDSSDSGTGVEASTLTTLLQRDETGEGVESVVARAIYAKEYPTGAIDLAKVLTAAITGDETGTGAEASLVAFYQKKADSGTGVDASTLVALFTGEDSGAGAEAITLLAAMVAQDTGVSVESVLSFFRKLIDSGQGEENLHLIGYVGRAMKLVTYLREYSDLVVYTKPHSDLRVYTSEVKQ